MKLNAHHPLRARLRPYLALAILAAPYFALIGFAASRRPLWNDELFTYYIARRPSLHDVWESLLTGVEQLPPLYYVITRASALLFGLNEMAIRLPAILGVGVAALCVHLFVARRASQIYGVAGALFFLATSAYEYAGEARPYGLVLAFSGLAFVSWQRAAEGGRMRLIALSGLAICLFAALYTHYYAVLILGPICAAELTRTYHRRRVDLLIWLSFTLPAASLLLLIPLMRAAAGHAGTFWAPASWLGALDFYRGLLHPGVLSVIALALAACVLTMPASSDSPRLPRWPVHDFVAMAGLALIPFAGVLLGKTVTGVFTPRYVMPAALGISVLAGWGLALLTRGRPRTALAATLILLACFLGVAIRHGRAAVRDLEQLRQDSRLLASTDPGLPIALANPHLFFKLSHYAPPPVSRRLFYLADPEIAVRRTGTDTPELGLMTLRRWAPLRVMGYREFTQSHAEFLIYGYPGPFAWLVPELVDERRGIEIVKIYDDKLLLRASGEHSGKVFR